MDIRGRGERSPRGSGLAFRRSRPPMQAAFGHGAPVSGRQFRSSSDRWCAVDALGPSNRICDPFTKADPLPFFVFDLANFRIEFPGI